MGGKGWYEKISVLHLSLSLSQMKSWDEESLGNRRAARPPSSAPSVIHSSQGEIPFPAQPSVNLRVTGEADITGSALIQGKDIT